MSLNIEDNANDLCHQEIEIHQTIAVNKLKEYFHIKESQIPCLVFKDISSQRYKNIIIPVTEDNLYYIFYQLQIEDGFINILRNYLMILSLYYLNLS